MRTILCTDAVGWLDANRDVGAIVTSLPDADEIGLSMPEWARWFRNAVALCVRASSPMSPVVFYQTDRKFAGRLISKASLVLDAAATEGASPLWHKIAVRGGIGKVDFYRPGFSHLIAVSRIGRSGGATPDVLDAGRPVYRNGIGIEVARLAVNFASGKDRVRVVDPFCGRGTIPAVADALGLDSIGIDIDPEQARASGLLHLSLPDLVGPPPWTR
jgi:hypothetical protein